MKTLYAHLPDSPGVYLMKGAKGKVLYVGKAGNLRRRVSSYFLRPHDARIEELVRSIKKIDFEKTDTAIEALIREAALIKKLSPPFNVREKDDKSFLFVEITKDAFPRVALVRGKAPEAGARYGPFTSATSIREVLRILRKIFPWSTHDPARLGTYARPCFDYEIGLCPGTCVGAVSRRDYMRSIRGIKLVFEGKRKRLLATLEKEMRTAGKKLLFEKAAKLRHQLFALRHIQDVALIGGDEKDEGPAGFRIEGYDISNISGTSAVGSMVVFVDGKPDKNAYRKFKIRTVRGADDVGMLTEMLRRRFAHGPEDGKWAMPDLILVDGGAGQVHAAHIVCAEYALDVPIVGIAKGPERKRNDILGGIPEGISPAVLVRVRDEAHRFAVAYHRRLRSRESGIPRRP